MVLQDLVKKGAEKPLFSFEGMAMYVKIKFGEFVLSQEEKKYENTN